MLVVSTPLVRPVTVKPWPDAGTVVGAMTAPGRGAAKNTLYGGVPSLTVKIAAWFTHVPGFTERS